MKHLIFTHYTMFRNKVSRLTFLDEVKVAVFLFIGLGFLSGVYLGTWRLLAYLNQVALVGPLLLNKLLALVFLTSFSMVVFSSLITSFTTIFLSRDLHWLMVTPLPVRSIFAFKALNTAFYASWMVLVALFPFFLALGQVKNVAISFYGGTLVLLVPFLILASSAGIVISLLLMRFFPSHRTRDFILLLGVLFMTGLYVLFRFINPERLVKPDGLEVVSQYLAYLDAPTAVYLPSWWLTGGMYSLLSGSMKDFTFYASLLWGSTAIALIAVTTLAEKFFIIGWAEGQIYHRRKEAPPARYPARSPFRALLDKDFTVFFRDTNQWSQILLLAALIVVYLFSIYKLPLETVYLQNLVAFVNVGLIGFIMAAVALRFVYPSVSLEGNTMWLLKVAPMPMSRLLREKFIFGCIPVTLMGALLMAASNVLLKADPAVCWLSLAAVVIMSLGLNALALGFGAMFPVFHSTNIAQIESSAGGLFYIVTAFFYLGITVSFWAAPLHNFYQRKMGAAALPWNSFGWLALGLLCINILAIAVPLWRGTRSLEELEK